MITPDLISRSNRKTLSLSILKDGQIVIKAPLKMSDQAIEKFVVEKQLWIRKKLAYIEHNREKFDDVMHLNKFLLFGNEYTLKLADIKKLKHPTQSCQYICQKQHNKIKFYQNLKLGIKKLQKTF